MFAQAHESRSPVFHIAAGPKKGAGPSFSRDSLFVWTGFKAGHVQAQNAVALPWRLEQAGWRVCLGVPTRSSEARLPDRGG